MLNIKTFNEARRYEGPVSVYWKIVRSLQYI